MFDFPARRTLLGEAVGDARVGSAMSLDIVAGSGTRALGPVAGGALYASLGVDGAFTASAALFLIAVAGLTTLRGARPVQSMRGREKPPSLLAELLAGARALRGNSRMVAIFAVTIVFNVWGFPFVSLVPVFGSDLLSLDAFEIGLLASAEGVGALIGALALASWARERQFMILYTGGVGTYLVLALGFAQSTAASLSATLLIAVGVASAAFAAMQSALVFLHAPSEQRQQMMGLLSVCIGTGPIGFLHLGFLADLIGTPTACTVVAIEGIVFLSWVLLRWRDALFGERVKATPGL